MPEPKLHAWSTTIGTARNKQSRTFVDLAEKLKMHVGDLMRQCNAKVAPSGSCPFCRQEDFILNRTGSSLTRKTDWPSIQRDIPGCGMGLTASARPSQRFCAAKPDPKSDIFFGTAESNGESGIAPEQRTENAEPRPQPPGDARLAQPEPYFGKANRKVYPSWCHSPGEKHLNKLEKP
jgi:hypothetical protein